MALVEGDSISRNLGRPGRDRRRNKIVRNPDKPPSCEVVYLYAFALKNCLFSHQYRYLKGLSMNKVTFNRQVFWTTLLTIANRPEEFDWLRHNADLIKQQVGDEKTGKQPASEKRDAEN